MKKKIAWFLLLMLSVAALAACGGTPVENNTEGDADGEPNIVLRVGASTVPHAEILAVAKPLLKEKGIDLEIKEFTDYVVPNTAVESKDLDANYFQTKSYLDSFNEVNGTHLFAAAYIHYEPFGIYPGKTASLEALGNGATIAIPSDPANGARALLLLEQEGLIKLKEGVGLNATANDIVENAKKIKVYEAEAAAVAQSTKDVDLAVINGNYAMEVGFTAEDSLAYESADTEAAQKIFANVIAVYEGDEKRPEVQALIEVLTSQEIKDFIEEKYQGGVVPVF